MTTTPGGPIKLTLTEWVQNCIANLYNAKNTAAFNVAFDNFLAQHATITMNGNRISRDQYKNMLQSQVGTSTKLTFDGMVHDSKATMHAGSVGLFYSAQIESMDPIKESIVKSSLNVVIFDDKACSGHGDPRQVKELNQVLLDHVGPEL